MQRVVILGSGGAGKSTLARALGERTGLPVVHLDRLYWKPGWLPTPDDEWHAMQVRKFAAARWIADGNYSRTLDARLPRADTVVFVDFPPWRTVPRVLRRWARNRGRAVQAEGCPERLDREFLRWVATYRRRSGRACAPRLPATRNTQRSSCCARRVRSRRSSRRREHNECPAVSGRASPTHVVRH